MSFVCVASHMLTVRSWFVLLCEGALFLVFIRACRFYQQL